MRIKWNTLIVCIAIPLAVGGIAGLLTRGGMEVYQMLNQPAFAPPGWLFPVVWTILYVLMGIASYLVLESNADKTEILEGMILYGYQLVVNFFWPIFFFQFQWYLFSFIWLVALWVLIIMTMIEFYQVSKTAAYLLIPYLVWVTFAGCLNFAIYRLN